MPRASAVNIAQEEAVMATRHHDPMLTVTQAERAAAAYRVLAATMRAMATEIGESADAELLERLADALAGPSPRRSLWLVQDRQPVE